MKDDISNISLDLLKALIEKIVEEVLAKTLASKNGAQNPHIQSSNINKGFTVFRPAFSLKAQREEHSKQLSETYKNGNDSKHKLGKKSSKKMNDEVAETYKNYKGINADLKDLHKAREQRHITFKK